MEQREVQVDKPRDGHTQRMSSRHKREGKSKKAKKKQRDRQEKLKAMNKK